MNNTLRIAFLIFVFILNSCGYQKTEEDKYPEIPVFPEHTNNKISIKEFPFYLTNIKYNQKNVFAHNAKGDWVIFDRKFNKIKQISQPDGYVHSYINKDGTIYFIIPNEKPELIEVYKLSTQDNFKKERIENLIINSREGFTIRDSLNFVYKDEIEKIDNLKINKHIDSLLSVVYQNEKEIVSGKIKKLKPNLISIYPLTNEVSVLKYKNKEFALYTRFDHTNNFNDLLKKTSLDGLEPIWNLEKSPKSFGKVVLGNSFSGNHYVGGYTPYGYNYVELSLKNETTKFKAKNSNNGNSVGILYESKDTLIVKDFKKLYYITLKK